MLDDLDAILGLPRSHEASGWKIHVGSGPVGTGTYVTLSYAVEYEDAGGTETLTLYSGDKGQEPRVVNHGFKSPALLER